MKRPRQHEIEDISVKIFSNKIPSGWLIRSISHDYGIDKVVEIVENQKLTGKELLVQLKGTERIRMKNGIIAFSLQVNNLTYYTQKDIPVLFTVVDITNEKCYWLFLQEYVYEKLNIENPEWTNQKTVTVHIPVTNEVSLKISELKEIAYAGPSYLLTKKLNRIPIEHLERWKDNEEAILKLLKIADAMNMKQFQIKFDVAYRYQKSNNSEKSKELLISIAKSAKDEKNDYVYIKATFALINSMNPFSQNKEILELLQTIKEVINTSGNKSFEIFWWGNFLETLFVKLITDYNSEGILHLVASQGHHKLMAPFMNIRIQETINKLYQIEEDFIKWLKEAYDNEEFYIYLDFQRRLAKMQFSWCYNNSLKGDKNAIYSQINSIKSTLLFSERIAEMISEDLKFQIIMDLAYLYHSVEEMKSRDEYLDKAMELATKLEHQGFQNEIRLAEYHFTNSAPTIPYLLDLKETPASPNEITDQQEENMLKFLLKISGIDITADDDLAKLARIGLKDRNPERILRHCKHLHTEIINYGPIWDAVALPSTGTKIIFCEMNQTAIIGRELDNLLDNFIESNCKTCDFHAPRENVWKWTREWHRGREKPEKMKKLIENYFKY